jgi:hypothetical protein
MNPRNAPSARRRVIAAAISLTIGAAVLASCGGSSSSKPTDSVAGQTPGSAAPSPVGGQVLPVQENPITNASAVEGLTIDSVLVENNVDPATGNDAADHLEIAVSNIGANELSGFEVFYTITDATDDLTENYYFELPATFTVPAGGKRVIHFDESGETDHFPVNLYSLYYTDKNALDLTVVVSAEGAAIQTAQVAKDAGGAENPDE